MSGLAGSLAESFTTQGVEIYMDSFLPTVGGSIRDLEGRRDEEMTDYEGFRIHLRHAVRRSISSSIGVVIAHPFYGKL
jgi:hypothetical protein